MKNLFLILKTQYYWQIFWKEKHIEYRTATPRFKKMIEDKEFVIFQLGYNKSNRMKVAILKIEETSGVYNIHLDLNSIEILNYTPNNNNQLYLL